MPLSQAAQKVSSRPARVRCGVGQLLDKLDEDDREFLLELLTNQSNMHVYIEEVLKADGITNISDFTIGRHRKGKCTCGQNA